MANEKVLKGPYWTRNWIEAMWRFTNENFVNFDTGAVDYEALGKEEFQFRKALFFRNFKNSERAKMAFASAEDDYKNPVENGKKGGRPKKSPQDAPNGNAGVDMSDARKRLLELANRNLNSGKPNHDKTNDPTLTVPTAGGSCGEISDAATTPCASTVSTNPSQEAPTRKAGDELTESGNGSLRNPTPSCEDHLDEARQSQRTGAAPERVKNQPSSHCGKAPVRSFGESGLVHMTDAQANSLRSYYGEDFDRAVGILENYILSLPSKADGDEKGEAKFWREDYAKRNHYFAMRRDNWVDNALKKAKTADKRLENASNPNYKSFKQQDIDARTEFFSKSIFDGKEAI